MDNACLILYAFQKSVRPLISYTVLSASRMHYVLSYIRGKKEVAYFEP